MTYDHRQIERDAAQWLARRDAGGWGDRQRAALASWLDESTAHRVSFLRLEATWNETARLQTLATGALQPQPPARGSWQDSPYFAGLAGDAPAIAPTTVRRNKAGRSHRTRRWPLLAAVAASLLAIAVIMGGLAWQDATHVDRGEWQTTLGAQRIVQLADGSTATLGSNSQLRAALSRRERDLYLPRGEAFFDVAHDAARPFIVHADAFRVIAVGTRFDVRHEEDSLRVVVTHGLVRLQSAQDPRLATTDLPAGSVALVRDGAVSVRQVPLDEAREFLTWRDGYVAFHGTPLAEAVTEFNRYNPHQIVIADPSLDALRVGGNFRLDNSAGFVRLMQQIFPVRAESRNGNIVLSRRSGRHRDH